jgi:uncharacterized membrane protein
LIFVVVSVSLPPNSIYVFHISSPFLFSRENSETLLSPFSSLCTIWKMLHRNEFFLDIRMYVVLIVIIQCNTRHQIYSNPTVGCSGRSGGSAVQIFFVLSIMVSKAWA